MEGCFTFQWGGTQMGASVFMGGGGGQKNLRMGVEAPFPPPTHTHYGKPCDWFIDALNHHEYSHFYISLFRQLRLAMNFLRLVFSVPR